MAIKKERRDFLGMALGGFTALGGIAALGAAKRTWDPLPSVMAAGYSTIDLSAAKPNVLNVEKWRGKPIFILKKSPDMKKDPREVIVGDNRYLICIGLCTHLGCIPSYFPKEHKFKCACHGGQFDASGRVLKSPPPIPLVIPPFKIEGEKVVIGEAGEEYKKLKADGLTV
ncbi:Rieske 2Fe-2S domain-containing protein [Sulfurospirillum sp. 1612]|uniref:Rieske 2Fe-2S domain-containing protein n=1 Tax=Sulfurospirillum sp. 1612 TaxID=3094835 RepID=UPI002F949D53